MKQHRRRDSQGGFTLVEVLASMMLIAIALVPVVKALANAQVTGTRSQRATQALFYAERMMEDVRAELLETFNTDVTTLSGALPDNFVCVVSGTNDGALLKLVRVQVGYDEDRDGGLDAGEITVTLDTKVARKL